MLRVGLVLLRVGLVLFCLVLSSSASEVDNTLQCSFCEPGSPCFVDVAYLCPPSSSAEGSDCVCHAGFFRVGDECVLCTVNHFCPGGAQQQQLQCAPNSESITGATNSSMCLCASGYEALACAEPPCANEALCGACEADKYKAHASNVAHCEFCPHDHVRVSAHECSACPALTVSVAGECVAAAGAFMDGLAARPCAPGSYQPLTNQTACTGCPADSFQSTSGATACAACPLHSSSAAHAVHPSNCTCDAGYTGAGECTRCAAGTVKDAGPGACVPCAAGTYAGEAESTCTACQEHSWSTSGGSECSCDAGFTLAAGACAACAAGTSKNDTGPGPCYACSAGSFAGAQGMTSCETCAPSTFAGAGSTACEACAAHEASAAGSATAAQCVCAAGYFRSASVCEACAIGSWRSWTQHDDAPDDEAACTQCAEGSTTTANASSTADACKVCLGSVAASGECVPCGAHASSGGAGACECDAGFSLGNGTCVTCASGSFKSLLGNHACAPCPTGTQGAAEARVRLNESCVGCPANTYWEAPEAGEGEGAEAGDPACRPCPSNSNSPPWTVGNCSCNAGYFADGGGGCEPCPPGTFSGGGGLWATSSTPGSAEPEPRSTCVLCGGAEYTPHTAATTCLACPPHSYGGAINTAQSDCECDAGFTGTAGGPCVACALGSFKQERGSAACSDCSPAAYWPEGELQTANHCRGCPAHSTAEQNALGVIGCACDRGFLRVSVNDSVLCTACAAKSYCASESSQVACPRHSETGGGAWDIAQCACVAGFHGEHGNCSMCLLDTFCPAGALAPLPCPANSSTRGATNGTGLEACLCAPGHYKEAGEPFTCRECAPDSFCAQQSPLPCPNNSHAEVGATECSCYATFKMQGEACVSCNASEVCLADGSRHVCVPGAANEHQRCVCAAGSFCSELPSDDLSGGSCAGAEQCLPCPPGAWCADNAKTLCQAHEHAPAASSAVHECRCHDGFFRDELGGCSECPLHHYCSNETRRAVSVFDSNLRTLATRTVLLGQAVCRPGFFRTYATDLCKVCPRNFFCPPPSIWGLPNVVRCADNQFTYETGASSSGDCVCLAGFKMFASSESVRCLPCAVGQRCQGGSVVEELCHLQNKVVSADHEACVCAIGFGFSDFECAPCAPGYVKDTAGDFECRPCADATYAVNATTCLPCPQHADARAAAAQCVCAPPYVWDGSSCLLCAEDHFWRSSACHSCPALARSNPGPAMALGAAACRCADGHHAAPLNVSGTLLCVACPAGEYERDGACTSCPSASWAPQTSTALPGSSSALSVCVCNSTCHAQRIDGSCAGECASTPPPCQQCRAGHHKPVFSAPGNRDNCSACPEGSFQPAAGAWECELCAHNEWHELREQTSAAACSCRHGLARDTNGSCAACLPGHYKDWLGDEACVLCEIGTYNPHVLSTICHMCAAATENARNFSEALANEGRPNNTSPRILASNTTTRQGAVSVLECVCEVGQQPVLGDGAVFCELCNQGSFKEDASHALCTYCGALSTYHGHSLLHHHGAAAAGASTSSHCLPCPAFSGQDETLVGPDKLRMGSVSDCMCFPGHESTDDGCRNCSQYMIQPLFATEECRFCPAGHFFVDRHVPCQLCDVAQDDGDRHIGLVLNTQNTSLLWGVDESDCVCRLGFERSVLGVCQPCSIGRVRGSNATRHCSLCAHDTFQDAVAQLTCIPCPQNSSTLELVGRASILQCVCDAGFQPMSQGGVCTPCAAGTFRPARLANGSDAECLPCPQNTYCPVGATQPLPCPAEEVSEISSQGLHQCQCKAGFGRSSAAHNISAQTSSAYPAANTSDSLSIAEHKPCSLCPRAFFSATSSNNDCTACPENKTTLFSGATNETMCVCIPGHGILDSITSSPCVPCAQGFFAPGSSNEQCTPCGWGTVTTPSIAALQWRSCQCNTLAGLLSQNLAQH